MDSFAKYEEHRSTEFSPGFGYEVCGDIKENFEMRFSFSFLQLGKFWTSINIEVNEILSWPEYVWLKNKRF